MRGTGHFGLRRTWGNDPMLGFYPSAVSHQGGDRFGAQGQDNPWRKPEEDGRWNFRFKIKALRRAH